MINLLIIRPHSLQFQTRGLSLRTLVLIQTACSTPPQYSAPVEPGFLDSVQSLVSVSTQSNVLACPLHIHAGTTKSRVDVLLQAGQWASPPPLTRKLCWPLAIIFTWCNAPSSLWSGIKFPPVPIHFRHCYPSHISDADPLLCTFPLCLSGAPHNEIQTVVTAALCLAAPRHGWRGLGSSALQGVFFSRGPDVKLGESKPGDFISFVSDQRFLTLKRKANTFDLTMGRWGERVEWRIQVIYEMKQAFQKQQGWIIITYICGTLVFFTRSVSFASRSSPGQQTGHGLTSLFDQEVTQWEGDRVPAHTQVAGPHTQCCILCIILPSLVHFIPWLRPNRLQNFPIETSLMAEEGMNILEMQNYYQILCFI